MGVLKSVAVDGMLADGCIKNVDVIRLRAAMYDDGILSPQEAETLFRLNDRCRVQDPAWPSFFVEAITDFIVKETPPEGYVTAANAAWLIAAISKDGRVDTKTELDLLINVLDRARWSPASLVRFALDQVKEAVVHGTGPLRDGCNLEPGSISEPEVELVRRILYAFGGDGGVAVTRAEAEVLFDINDAVGAKPNAAWTDLFAKAIANVVMGSSGYAVPSREEALQRDEWLDRRGDLGLAGMAGDVTCHSLSSIWSLFTEQSSEERALARLERQRIEIITSEEITEGEADWLAERLGRDGLLTDNELALLGFLNAEAPRLHPKLVQLLDRARAA